MIHASFFFHWLRKGAAFVFFGLLLLPVAVFGQERMDTGKVWGVGDTVKMMQLLDESNKLIASGLTGTGKHASILTKLDTVRDIYEHSGIKNVTIEANILIARGRVLYLLSRFDEASGIFRKVIDLFMQNLDSNRIEVARSYKGLGSCYGSTGRYEEAIQCFVKCLKIESNLHGAGHPDVGRSYKNIGDCYLSKGEYAKAQENFNQALDIFMTTPGPESSETAQCYNSMGGCLYAQGLYDEAIEKYQTAYSIQSKNFLTPNLYLATPLNGLGSCYYGKGLYDKSIESYNLALDIYLKTVGAYHPLAAKTYNAIGSSYSEKGELTNAIKYHLKALTLLEKSLRANPLELAYTYNNLGVAYQYQGRIEDAIRYHLKSLSIRKKSLRNGHLDVASSCFNLGACYVLEKNYAKSIEYFEDTQRIWSEFYTENHPYFGLLYNNLGSCYYSKGQYSDALQYHIKSYEIQKSSLGLSHFEIARSGMYISMDYKALGLKDSAIIYSQKVFSYTQNNPESIHLNVKKDILAYHGSLIFPLYKEYPFPFLLDSSYSLLREVPRIIRSQQQLSQNLGPEDRAGIQEPKYFEFAIAASLEMAKIKNNLSYLIETFHYSEQSKSIILTQALHETRALHFANIPDSLLEQEYDLRVEITYQEKKRQEKLDAGLAETDTSVLAYSSKIFDLQQQYEALKDTFENKYPEYYRLKYDFSTVSLPCVRDTLLHSGQALLEYFVGDSSVFAFVIARPEQKDASAPPSGADEGLHVLEIKKDFPLEAWVDSFRQGLYGYYSLAPGQRSDSLYVATLTRYIEYGRKLYARLVAPLEAWLPERVVVVPDGALGYLPFDALLTAAPKDEENFKDYPYLLHRHRFSYCYSATLLREMTDKKHHQAPSGEFAAFAPYFDGDTALLASLYPYDEGTRKDLQPLRYSGEEVAAARQLMGGIMLLGADATEKNFVDTAGHYRILHLATHGRADNRVGDYAFLAFTEIKDSIENELLYVKDLYNLELNADLVVLSACETGIGKLQRGEGIISLARAFAYAGAKSIVTTLWSINDARTAQVMGYFYDGLKKDRLSKDAALWQARTRYLKETDPVGAHPFFWAAFIPIGDMQPVVR